jgi:hypothetical protein
MSLNFLDTACAEQERFDLIFGLCDDQDGTKAYSNSENTESWIATVKNESAIGLIFTPVDKCLINDNEFQGRGRCDGILTSNYHLYFVELKNQPKSRVSDAIKQLDSTIEFFKNAHDINQFKHKKAFVCNKQRRHFQEVDNELNLSFYRKHKVRIDVQAEILIVA